MALVRFWLKSHWGAISVGLAVLVFGVSLAITTRIPDGATLEGTVEATQIIQTGSWHWHPQVEVAVVKLGDGRSVSARVEEGGFARVGDHVVVHSYRKLLGGGVEYWI